MRDFRFIYLPMWIIFTERHNFKYFYDPLANAELRCSSSSACLRGNVRCVRDTHKVRDLADVFLRSFAHVLVTQEQDVVWIGSSRLPPLKHVDEPRATATPIPIQLEAFQMGPSMRGKYVLYQTETWCKYLPVAPWPRRFSETSMQ